MEMAAFFAKFVCKYGASDALAVALVAALLLWGSACYAQAVANQSLQTQLNGLLIVPIDPLASFTPPVPAPGDTCLASVVNRPESVPTPLPLSASSYRAVLADLSADKPIALKADELFLGTQHNNGGINPIDLPTDAPVPLKTDGHLMAKYFADLRTRLTELPQDKRVISLLPNEVLSEATLQSALSPFLGQPINQELTQSVVSALVKAANKESRYLLDIYFPTKVNERVRDGVLVLAVQPALLGRVIARGQKHTAARDIECRVAGSAGSLVNLVDIGDDISYLNYSLWRQVGVVPEFTPGELPGTTDIVLTVQDQAPQQFTLYTDNSGSRTTNQQRVRAEAELGDVGGRFGHDLTYSLTASPDGKQYQSHYVSYAMPLERSDALKFSLTQSNSNRLLESGTFQARTADTTARWELTRRFKTRGLIRGVLGLDAEFKSSEDFLAFGSAPVYKKTAQLLQFGAGWNTKWIGSAGPGTFYVRAVGSPGNLVGLNDDTTFNSMREGAKSRYWYVESDLQLSFALPKTFAPNWTLLAGLRTQFTDVPLLSSERLGLTGKDRVRGYYGDSYIADAGAVVRLELQSPHWPLGATGDVDWDTQFVAFVDAGRGYNATDEYIPDLGVTARSTNISSHGVGLRLQAGQNFNLRSDIAKRHKGITNEGDWLWHTEAQLSF
jgi:hemolysin activation/secretion protein